LCELAQTKVLNKLGQMTRLGVTFFEWSADFNHGLSFAGAFTVDEVLGRVA
jgi:hypothetical protein